MYPMLSIEPCVVNGETSDILVSIKLKRQAFHPGVVTTFIEEVAVVQTYVRGQFFHVWVVTKEHGEAFVAHIKKFEPAALMMYWKDLRKQFPKTEAQVEKAADMMETVQNQLQSQGVAFTIDLKNFAPQLPKDPEVSPTPPDAAPPAGKPEEDKPDDVF
jgi:hypothetical protein